MEYGRRTSARSVYYINRYLNLCGVGTLVRIRYIHGKRQEKSRSTPGPVSRLFFFFLLFLLFFFTSYTCVQVQIYNIDLWNRLIARLWSAICSSVRRYARIPSSLSRISCISIRRTWQSAFLKSKSIYR